MLAAGASFEELSGPVDVGGMDVASAGVAVFSGGASEGEVPVVDSLGGVTMEAPLAPTAVSSSISIMPAVPMAMVLLSDEGPDVGGEEVAMAPPMGIVTLAPPAGPMVDGLVVVRMLLPPAVVTALVPDGPGAAG